MLPVNNLKTQVKDFLSSITLKQSFVECKKLKAVSFCAAGDAGINKLVS